MIVAGLSKQLEQLHGVQLEWEQKVADSKTGAQRHIEELQRKDEDLQKLQEDTRLLVENHEKKLAIACRDLCGAIDEQKVKEAADDAALNQSQQRVKEQRSMVRQLVDRNHALQGSLDKAVQKFEEVSAAYKQIHMELSPRELNALQGVPQPVPETITDIRVANNPNPDLDKARQLEGMFVAEASHEERNLPALRNHHAKVRQELAAEQAHVKRMEEFIRRVAVGPSTERVGGGYDLDFWGRREAAALLGIEIG